jgi:hypothetical protein
MKFFREPVAFTPEVSLLVLGGAVRFLAAHQVALLADS